MWTIIQREPYAFEIVGTMIKQYETAHGRIADEVSKALVDESRRAFEEERTPYKGIKWTPAALRTRQRESWQSLLNLSGTLIGALSGSVTRGRERSFAKLIIRDDQVKLANIHIHGVQGASRSARYRLKRSRLLPSGDIHTPKGGGLLLPARSFVGVSESRMEALRKMSEQVLSEEVRG